MGHFARIILIVLFGGLTAGCFQALYGQYSVSGSSSVAQSLAAVDVPQIDAPEPDEGALAVEVRNDLLFALQGGEGGGSPTHSLKVRLIATRPYATSVDVQTGLSTTNVYALSASYELTDLRTGKVVLRANATAPVSYDNPGEQQRFANARALKDAQSRGAQEISDTIKVRLASFFVAGT
jgi:LPS-assembly lipoprotein